LWMVVNVSRLIVCTVGFDEKLVLRSLLKVSFSVNDAVVLVYSSSGGDYEAKRVESAVGNIKNLLASAGVRLHEVIVSSMDFAGDVASIVRALKEYAKDASEIIAAVTGGMRLTIVETIVALKLYRDFFRGDISVEVYVAREDGLYDVTLPVNLLDLPALSPREIEVLKRLNEGVRLLNIIESLSTGLNINRRTAYKYLYRLKSRGFIEIRDRAVYLTLAGKLIKEAV